MAAASQPAAGPAGDLLALPQFLGLVLGDGPGYRCMFDAKTKRHHWATDNAGLSALIDRGRDEQGIYFGTAVYATSANRTAENVRTRRSFCLDIDAGEAKYAKHGDTVYESQRDAIAGLVAGSKLTGIAPTVIVSSGAGLHAYFCLDADLGSPEWAPRAAKFKHVFKLAGLRADDAVTADVTRILRPPGTLHTSGNRVAVLKHTGRVYTLGELDSALGSALDKPASGGAKIIDFSRAASGTDPASGSLNARLIGGNDDEVTDNTIAELRSALLFLARRGYGGENSEWHNTAEQLATLKGTVHEPEARGLYMGFSAAAPNYTGEDDAAREWDKARGERTRWKAIFKTAYAHGWPGPDRPGTAEPNAVNPLTPADRDVRPTDLALSELWCNREKGRFGFDHSRQAWMHHASGAWRACDREQHVESFKGMAGQLRRDAGMLLQRAGGDATAVARAKRFIACADRAQSASGTRAALSLAQSSPLIAMTFDQFDRDPELFNVANGVVHLPTGELRPHDPALMLHRQSPVSYDPDAKCPLFDEFLRQVSLSDTDWIDNLQRFLGYCLSAHTHEERAAFWLGNGANGKSVLGNEVRYVFGTYAASAPSTFLMQSRRDSSSATPELAMLPGVRLLMANEVEAGSRLSAHILKVAVSTEHIAARPLYGHPMSFKPTHKTIIRGNHRPIIVDDDEGIWRRIDLVPFDLKLTPAERDGGLEARLLSEAPGILAWMVRGFARWRQDGLRPCRRVMDASLAYRKESDILGQWLDDACDVGQGYEVAQRAAYGHFRQWCGDQGLRYPSKKSFTRILRERGISDRRDSTGTRAELYTGLRLKP